jgi:hypothetical protein
MYACSKKETSKWEVGKMTRLLDFGGRQQQSYFILITITAKAFAPPCGSYTYAMYVYAKVHKYLNMTFTLGRSMYVVEG